MSDSENAKTETQNSEEHQVRLVDIPVESEGVALNLLVSFLNVGQRRGAFTLDESAKIWECVKLFQQQQPDTSTNSA